ncbi:hypothetical protein, partial [Bartonella raoultii]|uniref:hypothetical protein n=1 Tax=Bartonella raoultii TaxID=1457020 RepID=UPI0024867442
MMKKLYTTQTACDLNFSRSHERTSFFKVVSLGTAVVLFLSNVSPVFSAKLDLTKVSLESVKNSAVVYPQTILSPYNDDNSGMDGDKSVINVLTVDGSSIRRDAQNIFTAGIVVVSNLKKDKKTKNAVVLNPKTYTTKKKSAAIGFMARALGISNSAIDSEYNHQDDIGEYTFVNDDSSRARAKGNADIAIETKPETRAYSNVILGDGSATETPAGIYGYSSLQKGPTNNENFVWKSTAPAATVGDSRNGLTRQIQGVAAGTQFSDAANVGQLKVLEMYVDQGWKLSVGGENATTVGIKNVVDLSTESNNIKITKGKDNNNVKFDLAENLKLTSVTTGNSKMSNEGFEFIDGNGPKIALSGIDAGSKKITKVAAGEHDTDAVNYKQLMEVRDGFKTSWQLAVNGGDATHIGPNGVVNLQSVGGESNPNIRITKDSDNTVEFDLADNINVMSVTAGESIMDAVGFRFEDNKGPSITIKGINAGGTTIKGVAEGTDDTDAVNFKQLTEVKGLISKAGGWKLSVEDGDATDVQAGGTVNFAAAGEGGSKNIKIVKDDNNKVTFSLNDKLKLTSVTTGNSIMDENGFGFIDGGGPKITLSGIDAGSKKITKVADGAVDTDAVNYKQLTEVRTLAENGWKLSVDGNNATDVKAGNTVDLAAADQYGSKNITIEKNNKNKVTFALNDKLKLMSVTTGNSIMDNSGFGFVDGGPKILESGIQAGGKKITEVADAADDTDAVNYKQLKAIKQLAENGWKLSVNGADATDVKAGSTVDFFAIKHKNDDGSENDDVTNIKIEKEGNKVSFDLNDYIKVNRVETGLSSMSNAGFMIKGGPRVTFGGIHAGNKTISGVANGVLDEDAVNISQLKEIKNEIAGNSLVKWDEGQKFITIGKEKDGTKIDIANKSGDARTISGVKAAEKDDEAVNKKQLDGHIENINTIINNIKTDNAFAVRYDKKDDNTVNYNSVTLGGDKSDGPVALLNVKDGAISEQSNDAINGSQISTLSGEIAKFFGGGTEFNNGVFSGPRYNLSTVSADGNVEQKTFNSVGDALTGLDANVKNVNSRLTYVDNKFDKFSQDALLWDEGKGAFSAGHEKDGRKTDSKITSLLNGDVTEDSTDAINGSQLYTMGDKIADYFGGGAHYENGKWAKGPEFKVSERNENGTVVQGTYYNVADAFEGVDHSITDIYNQINNVTENSLVKQEGEDGLITVGKKTGGIKISVANKDSQERTISGVKEAELSITSTEAVNGSQLFKTDQKVTTVTNDLSKVAQNTSAYFGGSTDVLRGIKPTFVIDGNSYDNVTSAFTGVNVSIHKIDNKISDLEKNNLVKQEGGVSAPITIGKDTAGTEINIAGVGKVARKISGVREAEKGDEAVNKNQLDKSIEKISKDIETASAAAVLYDKDEDGIVNYGSVTLGGDKNNGSVALRNVKDGRISQDSHDAINGSQINKISGDIANYFGGDAKFVDGAFKGPKYSLSVIVEDGTIGNANYRNVGDALTGLDANVKSVNNRITNVANNFNQKIEGISKDALLWDDEEQAFVARREKDGKKTNSKLKYLVDGDISKNSTDAINGSQLYSISNQLAAYFGGGAKYENGEWTAPQFKIVQVNVDGTTVEKTHDNVADALGDVNKNMSNINNRIDDVINKVDSDALKWNKEKGAYDATHDGKPRKIINVADGKIEKGSKDAVNGGQLWQTNERVAKVENRVTDVEKHVEIIDKRVDNISNTIGDIGNTVNNINVKVDK